MKELTNKISSYNLFNNLLPGTVFAVTVNKLTSYDLSQDNVIYTLLFYYFIGICISRVGAIVLNKPLKKLFRPDQDKHNYSDYINCCEKDKKVEVFSKTNNMYRTFIAVFVLIPLTLLYEHFTIKCDIAPIGEALIILILLLLLFTYSYKRQTSIIVKRIMHHKNKTP